MLAIAGADSRIEISTLTDDQNALHTAKVNELRNMDKIWCGGCGRQTPQWQQVLLTRWVSKQRLDGSYKVRLVAQEFEQTVSSDTDFYAGTPKLTTLRALLTITAVHGNPVAFGDCHSAVHQPMPSESDPVYVEPAPEEQLDKKAYQGLKISPKAWGSQHTENQRHELHPADVRSFDEREETCTTIRRFDPLASHG